MSEQNLSQWFNLAEHKPWEVGVYEVETKKGNTGYSYWCGVRFNWATQDKGGSKEYFDTGYTHGLGKVVIKWRGLSTNPEGEEEAC